MAPSTCQLLNNLLPLANVCSGQLCSRCPFLFRTRNSRVLQTFSDNWKTWNICVWIAKHFQGLHFFGKQARDPEEFKAAVRWWLGGTIRLGLVPAIWLLVPEVGLRFERISDFQKKFDILNVLDHGSLDNRGLLGPTRCGTGRTTSTTCSSLSLAMQLLPQRTLASESHFGEEDGFILSRASLSAA